MQQQRGFTLIELIIVIVILGILAVTAAPRFIDIQGDATASTLQGVRAALQGGSQLVYAKSAIAGKQKNPQATTGDTSEVTIGTNEVETDFGYPDAELTSATNLVFWVDINSDDFTVVEGGNATTATATAPAAGTFAIIPATGSPTVNYTLENPTDASCHVLYTEPDNANESAVVTAVTGGC